MRRKRLLAKALRFSPVRALVAPNLRFRVQKWRVTHQNWGDRPTLRIGILSDLHWGFRPVTPSLIRAAKIRLAALSPDIVLFLGDLSEGKDSNAKQKNLIAGAKALGGMSAPLGLYAVLGNHDWHDDPAAQARRTGPVAAAEVLEQQGFGVLQNEAAYLEGAKAWIAGLDSQQAFKGERGEAKRAGADDMPAILSEIAGDQPVILLAHEPDIFPDLDDPRIVLTLSGHMHGGQIRPFGRAIYAPSRHGTKYAYGHYQNEGRHLVVSGGLGCSTIPVRIGIVPEITLVELSGR